MNTGGNKRQHVRASVAAFVGTMIEWYDFYIYGTASALVFGQLFFPMKSAFIGTLASFATFAVGFFARPLGAIVFGHLGDKIGRKKTLIATLVIMGTVTICIGLLPTYASVGIWAPIMLVSLRILQGIAVGGEWGVRCSSQVNMRPKAGECSLPHLRNLAVPRLSSLHSWRSGQSVPCPKQHFSVGAGACLSWRV